MPELYPFCGCHSRFRKQCVIFCCCCTRTSVVISTKFYPSLPFSPKRNFCKPQKQHSLIDKMGIQPSATVVKSKFCYVKVNFEECIAFMLFFERKNTFCCFVTFVLATNLDFRDVPRKEYNFLDNNSLLIRVKCEIFHKIMDEIYNKSFHPHDFKFIFLAKKRENNGFVVFFLGCTNTVQLDYSFLSPQIPAAQFSYRVCKSERRCCL